MAPSATPRRRAPVRRAKGSSARQTLRDELTALRRLTERKRGARYTNVQLARRLAEAGVLGDPPRAPRVGELLNVKGFNPEVLNHLVDAMIAMAGFTGDESDRHSLVEARRIKRRIGNLVDAGADDIRAEIKRDGPRNGSGETSDRERARRMTAADQWREKRNLHSARKYRDQRPEPSSAAVGVVGPLAIAVGAVGATIALLVYAGFPAWVWITLVALVSTAALVVVTILFATTRRKVPTFGPEELTEAKTTLAESVAREWDREWDTRMQYLPMLPVSWNAADGHDAASPPGRGWADGVWEVFRRLPPDTARLLVIGEGGSGKTVLSLRFALDVLGGVTDWSGGEPVPVYVPAVQWDPTRQSLDDLLTEQIKQHYEGFAALVVDPADRPSTRRRAVPKSRARLLVESGAVLAVVDGLDEMRRTVRAAAVEALNHAARNDRHFLVTSRDDELADALSAPDGPRRLESTVTIHMEPLCPDAAVVRYIADSPAATEPWRRFADRLTAEPEGAVAVALRTPLMVALSRTVYGGTGRDPGELLESDSAAEVRTRLLEAFFDAVYDQRPRSVDGQRHRRPRPTHQGRRPRRWLRFLARRMRHPDTAALGWWQFRRMAPLGAVEAGCGIAAGIGLAAAVALLGWTGLAVAVGPVLGLVFGTGFDHMYFRLRMATSPEVDDGGFRGVPDAHAATIARRGGLGLLAIAVAVAVAAAITVVASATGARWLPPVPELGDELLVLGLGAPLASWASGLVIGLVAGLSLNNEQVSARVATITVSTPSQTLARDRVAALATLSMFGTAVGLITGVTTAIALDDPGAGVVAAVLALFAGGLAATTMFTAYPPYLLTRWYLTVTGRLPVRLWAFLDEAHEWEVLRLVGARYQFRHAALSEYLAQDGHAAPHGGRHQPNGQTTESHGSR